MAYDTNQLFLVHEAGGRRAQKWVYEGTDAPETVAETGFISNAFVRGMKVGDEVLIKQYASSDLAVLTQPVLMTVSDISLSAGATLKRFWDYIGDPITASLTLSRVHVGKLLPANSGSAIALTVPASIFTRGEGVFAYQYGAGQLSFVAGVGTTIRTPSGLNAAAQYATIGVECIGTDEFLAVGNLTA